MSAAAAIGWAGASAGLAFALRAAGVRGVVFALAAALVPVCLLAFAGLDALGRLAGFPLAAAAFEVAAATRVAGSRTGLLEAWLCAGARPLEALSRSRVPFLPAIVVALALVAAELAPPVEPAGVPVLLALAGCGAASLAASALVAARAFVDSRLTDRPPPEARAPFRMKPYEPPATLEVYESRPPE